MTPLQASLALTVWFLLHVLVPSSPMPCLPIYLCILVHMKWYFEIRYIRGGCVMLSRHDKRELRFNLATAVKKKCFTRYFVYTITSYMCSIICVIYVDAVLLLLCDMIVILVWCFVYFCFIEYFYKSPHTKKNLPCVLAWRKYLVTLLLRICL